MINRNLDIEAAVREFSGMAYSLAFRILGNHDDAKETVQESFTKLYGKRDTYLEEKNLKNWIYTITLNTARDLYRKKKRQSEIELSEQLMSKGLGYDDDKVDNSLYTQKLLSILRWIF